MSLASVQAKLKELVVKDLEKAIQKFQSVVKT